MLPGAFEQSNVGQFLGAGNDHEVYEYGSEMVVKFPKTLRLHPMLNIPSSFDSISRDLHLAERYIGEDALLPSSVFPHSERSYALVQQKLPANQESLRPRHVRASEQVRMQLDKMLINVQRLLVEQNLYMELVGLEGYMSRRKDPQLSNVKIVESDGTARLMVTDFTLEPIESIPEVICADDLSSSTVGTIILLKTRSIIARQFGFQLEHPCISRRPAFPIQQP